MSDVAVTEPETESTLEVDEAEPFDADRAKAKIAKVNGEAKGLRARVKELEAYEAQVKAAEDATKSEIEKAADRAAKAEQRAAQVESELIRERIARRYKIADDDLDLLGSGTEAEIEGRAKRIAAKDAAASKVEAPPSDRPVEKLRPGALPAEAPKPESNLYPASWLPSGRANL
jgi:chromosomal replication initiation ATPase DnaA